MPRATLRKGHTDHVIRDRQNFTAFFRRLPAKACGFTLETLRVYVKEIGTYKLNLQGGHTLTFM